jgi:hypothetical protein
MIPRNYRRLATCRTCVHCFHRDPMDSPTILYCAQDAVLRTVEDDEAAMRDDWDMMTEGEKHAVHVAWQKWITGREVSCDCVCAEYREKW